MTNRRFLSFLALALAFFACQPTSKIAFPYSIKKSAIAEKAMVVSAHPLASEVGAAILKKGGNAVDAAVAVQLALAVVYPQAGNLGGGGFMVFRSKTGETAALDYREKAPAGASRDMYLDATKPEKPVIADLSEKGHLAAGVPGTVAGLAESHRKYGKMAWADLVQPAVDLARKGFPITLQEAENLNEEGPLFTKNSSPSKIAFVKKGAWKTGDVLKQKDLAATLELIQKNGEKGFYEGPTAEKIVREMAFGKGLISLDDLRNYRAVWREPIRTKYKNFELVGMPPPSSGGLALAQLLAMVENRPLKNSGFQSADAVHLMVEAERRVYADRATWLGDPDFFGVPTKNLTASSYLNFRMATFNPEKATPSKDVAAGELAGIDPKTGISPSKKKKESEETTHLSIVDADGNAVSVTTTLNDSYGSRTIVGGAGFILNNEMDDFSSKPGQPNLYGLIGGEANAIEPAKRMLSSMTPTIVSRDGKLWMVVGTPGGSTIITSVFQVFLNVAEFGMTLEEAVQAPRFHSQWTPDKIFIEPNALSPSVIATLEKRGHVVEKRGPIGRVEAILVRHDGKLEGTADRRGDDHAAGF